METWEYPIDQARFFFSFLNRNCSPNQIFALQNRVIQLQ